ncbi:leucyl/phenylalanyl-tRNA--protein transferase [Pedobacter sp. SYP-B3415]|uniref:leucyl/phenylalanyl-tRNA--protein transferase n=1 Tax=Pedobacter sp. SYP-B3415 TaxID=2496641 RepID=UPI00101B949D|nr:leucyl/phenylalanyl-tRNA--protein transferase [Pedobacter sp. SYP-B3415]
MIFQLDENDLRFPAPAWAEPDGLLAIGGDLRPERLLAAYHLGIFPWFSEGDPVCWYAPPDRCVIYPEHVSESKSMRRLLNSGVFEIKVNTCFEEVIRNCASIDRQGATGTWITNDMQAAYIELHRMGFAKSIETWKAGVLAGGLYGIEINGVFCGESMFSKESNASKAALIWLCRNGGHRLVDCQLPNDHLMSMGAEMISREKFLEILRTQL